MFGRIASAGTLAFAGLLAAPAVQTGKSDRYENPWTLMPYQTATFVHDKEAGRLLNELSEFSTQLLVWDDTPRSQSVTVGGIAKTGLLMFVREHNSQVPPTLNADAIV